MVELAEIVGQSVALGQLALGESQRRFHRTGGDVVDQRIQHRPFQHALHRAYALELDTIRPRAYFFTFVHARKYTLFDSPETTGFLLRLATSEPGNLYCARASC